MTPPVSCPGWCCAVIQLPFSLEDWREIEAHMLDGEQIGSMVEPLTADEARERAERFGAATPDGSHHFACRHWDEATRLCRIYENRPTMCRDYPYGEPCKHCGLADGISLRERAMRERGKATPRE